MKRLVLFLSIILSFQLIFGTAYGAKYAEIYSQNQDFENVGKNELGSVYKIDDDDAGYYDVTSDGLEENRYLEIGVKSSAAVDSKIPYLNLNLPQDKGIVTVEGKIYLSSVNAKDDSIMLWWYKAPTGTSRGHYDLKMEYKTEDPDNPVATLDGVEIKIGEYNTFKYVIDVDNLKLTSYYNDSEPKEKDGFSTAANFNRLAYFRIQPKFTKSMPGYFRLDDVKITTTYKQGEILSVNSDADAAYNSAALSFEMDSLPLKSLIDNPEYIEVTGGTSKLVGSSVTIDGTKVNVILSGNLESSTTYELKILKDAYVNDVSVDSAGDITKSFNTKMSDFDIRVPSYSLAGEDLTISTEISNYVDSGGAKDVTLMAVTYEVDSGGKKRIVDIDADSYTVDEGTSRNVSVDGIRISANRIVKMYVIDGWAGKRPVFGKSWEKTYDEINEVN